MPSGWTTVTMSDGGRMDGYLASPPAGRGPGIVMLQEIFGINAGLRQTADDFAAAGYTVLVPDLFWRLAPRVDLGYGEADRKRAFAYWDAFDNDQGAADVGDAIEHLRGMKESGGKVAAIGFCLGGKLAVLAAARSTLSAAVSYYGVRLHENLAEIDAARCPLQFHFADEDPHVPPSTVASVRAATEARADVEIHLYAGAQHGFYNPVRPYGHDPAAAALSRERTLAFLEQALR